MNGCRCSLFVKTYNDTAAVLGSYSPEHSHEIGNANLKFVPVSKDARQGILSMAMEDRSTEHIVSCVYRSCVAHHIAG